MRALQQRSAVPGVFVGQVTLPWIASHGNLLNERATMSCKPCGPLPARTDFMNLNLTPADILEPSAPQSERAPCFLRHLNTCSSDQKHGVLTEIAAIAGLRADTRKE